MRIAIFCAALALGACGSETSTPEPVANDERPSSVIGDPLHQALDRAESVQGTIDDRAADMRRRLEEAEGN
jgi:hypothetical protein